MRCIIVEKRLFTRLFAAIILGLFLGSLFAMFWSLRRMDALVLDLERVREENRALLTKIAALEESLAQKKKNPIKEIKAKCLSGNEHLRLAVEGSVRELLSELIGKDYTEVDPELIYRTIDGRVVNVDKQTFKLHLKTLLIWEIVSVVVDV